MDAQFGIIPKIVCPATYRIWILPSSHWPGFFHLTIYVRYVRGQTMLIRCCFTIIAMVDTIFSASNQSSLKFLLAFGTVHHVLLQHLDFYLDHATLFLVQVLGRIHENFISTSSCALYIYVCVCAYLFGWLVSTFDWFQSFFLVEFPMDLHPYDTVCHDITCHNICHVDKT
jgi:hypothetical protein